MNTTTLKGVVDAVLTRAGHDRSTTRSNGYFLKTRQEGVGVYWSAIWSENRDAAETERATELARVRETLTPQFHVTTHDPNPAENDPGSLIVTAARDTADLASIEAEVIKQARERLESERKQLLECLADVDADLAALND